jgi:hypothetical protein
MQARFAAPGANRLTLDLRADRPDTPVTVAYQGHALTTLRVGTTWQRYEVPIPAAADQPAAPPDRGVLDLRAPTYVVSPAEPYPRGVAIAGASLERGP